MNANKVLVLIVGYELLTWDHDSSAQQWDALRYDCDLIVRMIGSILDFAVSWEFCHKIKGVTPPSSKWKFFCK